MSFLEIWSGEKSAMAMLAQVLMLEAACPHVVYPVIAFHVPSSVSLLARGMILSETDSAKF